MVPKMLMSAVIVISVLFYPFTEGTEGDAVPQGRTEYQQGSCRNHFAEFFYQISRRNARTLSHQVGLELDQQWLSTSFQLFELSALLQDWNRTEGNSTQADPTPSPRFECKPNPAAQNRSGRVNLVNSTELLRLITERPNASLGDNVTTENNSYGGINKSADSVCVVVMFYTTSCRFSAATAPEFNALGRALRGVDVLAFDIDQSSGVNSRYGIVAVPSIALFQNGKLATRFNETQRSLEKLLVFVHNLTGLSVNTSISVSAEDHVGPVPTTAIVGPDYFLWFSNVFLLFCGLGFLQEKVGAVVRAKLTAIREYVTQVWRTGEFYEQVGIADNEHEPQVD